MKAARRHQSPDIVLTGAGGMLGRRFASQCTARGLSVLAFKGRDDLDITNDAAVHRIITDAAPQIVINAAGYTDVDGAEAELTKAMAVNADGPAALARACAAVGAMLVQFSSDYIFDGRGHSPHEPNDERNPLNAYGRSKLAGENGVVASGCRHLIIRTSWLHAPDGHNFVLTIHRLAQERDTLSVVNDQRGRPTFCDDLAELTLRLLANQATGVWHVCNSGEATWFEVAREVVNLASLPCEVRPCTTAEMPRPARRPAYSVLDLTRTVALLGEPRHWKAALAECVQQLQASPPTRAPAS